MASDLKTSEEPTAEELDALRELQRRGSPREQEALILDAVRTPFGRAGGALAGVRPDDLAAHAVRGLLARAPDLDPARIDDVVFGDANGAGEDNRNVGRMAVLLAGLPTSVPANDRQPPVRLEPRRRDAGEPARSRPATPTLVLVGGVESMSRAPWVLLKPERAYPRGHETLHSTTLGWRMVNPEMPEAWTISLGESTEKVAGIYGISREAQDEFAVLSHQRAAAAWDDGFYDSEWVMPVPVGDDEHERDEGIRPDTSVEKLAKLKPAFAKDGTVTAGNASPLNDGAGALLLGTAEARARRRAWSRSRGSPGAGRSRSTPTCSASRRSRRPTARWSARASAGATSRWRSSTRRSRRSRWRAWASGISTRSG